MPYLRAANVNDGSIAFDDVLTMNFTPAEQAIFRLECGDILVTEGSGSLQQVGQSAVWRGELAGVVCFQNTLLRLRPKAGLADAGYLAWWARHAYASGLFASASTGANIFHLSAERLRTLPIPVPSIALQRGIAGYLDAETARLDALIAKKRRMIGLLSERRAAVMVEGVSGRFTEVDFRNSRLPWLTERGSDWSEVRLAYVAHLGTGHTPSRDHPEWWVDCAIPWITTGEVAQMRSDRTEFIYETRESISELGLANSSAEKHPAGTVVLCRTAASAGYSSIMGTEMATSQDFATWTCTPLLRPRFLLLCLRAMRQDLLGRLAMGSTHKTIYMPDIESLRIPLPSVEVQNQIVEAVWSRLNLIDQATDGLLRQVDLLREHRRTIIAAAVTGRMEIPGVAA